MKFILIILTILTVSCSKRINVLNPIKHPHIHYSVFRIYPSPDSSIISIYVMNSEDTRTGGYDYKFYVKKLNNEFKILEYKHGVVLPADFEDFTSFDKNDYYISTNIQGNIKILKEAKNTYKVKFKLLIDEKHFYKELQNKIKINKRVWLRRL